ncbi:hypothetical protein PoB_007164500 [Plakobranchus ocellatus]|uniref:C2H2-type domain-containing protein n=1 Tax=Plakobranchus ocellatus TaxID=259542 RepID=A0AAV4DMJ9_9GAST|nr:hypothetical protein PoB_007164500 [Plakobranchus ocellatus]
MPFDAFCPWLVKKGTLARRCCSTCGQYFPSIAAKNRHQAAHSTAEVMPAQEDQDEDEESLGIDASEEEDAPAPIYRNILEIMRGPFVLDE